MIEKVNPCHPDKMADRIAGAIVDLAYKKDNNPKIAVEVLIGHNECNVIIETNIEIIKTEVMTIVERITKSNDIKLNLKVVPQDKYLAENQNLKPDITLNVTEERLDNYILSFPHLSRSLAEYIIYGMLFYEAILDYDGILLHSSAISVDNEAYLFTANSGIGKSTHCALWMKYFGDRAVMINDDKPVIRIIDNKIYACGTPFSGKHDINKNILVPLKGICCINQGKENVINKISTKKAIGKFLPQTLCINDKDKMSSLLAVLDKILSNVNVYELFCDISEEAVKTSYNMMSKN